jgi:hypothetical protein
MDANLQTLQNGGLFSSSPSNRMHLKAFDPTADQIIRVVLFLFGLISTSTCYSPAALKRNFADIRDSFLIYLLTIQ